MFLLVTSIFIWGSLTNKHTTIYISSHRKEAKQDLVKLYVDGNLKDTISLKKHYDLNLYKNKHSFTLGKHGIILKSLDDKVLLRETFYNFGFVNWITISCYEDLNYTFITSFSKPKFL